MEELTGLFDLPQRSAKMVEGRGRSREGIGRRREATLASVRDEGRRKNGLVGGIGPARSHQARNCLFGTYRCYLLSMCWFSLEEERVMQQSSVSISLSF